MQRLSLQPSSSSQVSTSLVSLRLWDSTRCPREPSMSSWPAAARLPARASSSGKALRGRLKCSAADSESKGDANRAVQEYDEDAVQKYVCYVSRPDSEIDLLTAVVFMAQCKYPDLTLEEVQAELDDLAGRVVDVLDSGVPAYPLRVCRTISKVLYEQEGFDGDRESYYNTDNSYINRVLQRRRGIPISLALVYMEVAARAGLTMYGLAIPGHFMLTPADEEMQLLVDPFYGGEVCFLEDAEERLGELYGQPVKLDEDWVANKEQVPPRAFLGRWLNNLKQIHIHRREPEEVLQVLRLLRATRPEALQEVRDTGLFLAQTGRYRESIEVLEDYLTRLPDAPDAEVVRALLAKARSALLEELLQNRAYQAGLGPG